MLIFRGVGSGFFRGSDGLVKNQFPVLYGRTENHPPSSMEASKGQRDCIDSCVKLGPKKKNQQQK